MEIREFYGEETLEFYRLCTQLFHSPASDEEIMKKVQNASPREGFFRFGAFEDGFLSAIEAIPFTVRFDGHDIKMSGIGGVVSAQEARGKGTIKAIFDTAFKKMYENGQILSHLYPFRGDYYRKFNYEPSAQTKVWHIPTEYFRTSKQGYIRLYDESEKMKQDLKALYNVFIKNKNLALSEKSQAFYDGLKPYSSPHFSYLHYSDDGTADGFICYHMQQYPDKRQNIIVENFWYSDINGIIGLLSYIASLKDYSDSTVISCNDDLAPFIEFNGGWGKRDSYYEGRFNGSSRIIDVEKMLSLADFEGKVTLKINDSLCPWNNDVFTLSDGVVTRGGTADAEAEIGIFSAMLLGRCDNISLIPNFRIIKNEQALHRLFKPKDIWFDEHF